MSDDQPGVPKRFFSGLRHEFGNMPLTFIASLFFLLDLIRSAVTYFVPSLAIGTSSAPVVVTIPSIPVPGVNLVVRLCLFLVIQGAFMSIYTRTMLAIIKMRWHGLHIILIVCAIIASWLSTFISFEVAAMAAPEANIGMFLLVISSISAALILVYFVANSNPEGNDEDDLVLTGMATAGGLIIFTIFFISEVAKYFGSGHS
jgi:hypothetical protein